MSEGSQRNNKRSLNIQTPRRNIPSLNTRIYKGVSNFFFLNERRKGDTPLREAEQERRRAEREREKTR